MSSSQLSLLAEEAAVSPAGLEYHSAFLAAHEEVDLLAKIDGCEWLGDLARRVQHYGY